MLQLSCKFCRYYGALNGVGKTLPDDQIVFIILYTEIWPCSRTPSQLPRPPCDDIANCVFSRRGRSRFPFGQIRAGGGHRRYLPAEPHPSNGGPALFAATSRNGEHALGASAAVMPPSIRATSRLNATMQRASLRARKRNGFEGEPESLLECLHPSGREFGADSTQSDASNGKAA